MNEDDLIRLQHMLDAAQRAKTFVRNRRRSDLLDDDMLTFALMKAIEIIGEAASNISKETRDQLSQFEWDKIIGMRHRLIHAYYLIDLDVLWDTAQKNIPDLIDELKRIPYLK
jgi:uncharacterized protein with HEPN domain